MTTYNEELIEELALLAREVAPRNNDEHSDMSMLLTALSSAITALSFTDKSLSLIQEEWAEATDNGSKPWEQPSELAEDILRHQDRVLHRVELVRKNWRDHLPKN